MSRMITHTIHTTQPGLCCAHGNFRFLRVVCCVGGHTFCSRSLSQPVEAHPWTKNIIDRVSSTTRRLRNNNPLGGTHPRRSGASRCWPAEFSVHRSFDSRLQVQLSHHRLLLGIGRNILASFLVLVYFIFTCCIDVPCCCLHGR